MSKETTIDLIELEEFNRRVDQIIDEIEANKISENPLRPTAVGLVQETATEKGEEKSEVLVRTSVIDQLKEEVPPTPAATASADMLIVNGTAVMVQDIPEGDKVVQVTNGTTTVYFKNAAEAAKAVGLNPTTVRSRASKEYVDKDNLVWSYL